MASSRGVGGPGQGVLEEDRLLSLLLSQGQGARGARVRGSFGARGGRRARGAREGVSKLLGAQYRGLLEDLAPGQAATMLAR